MTLRFPGALTVVVGVLLSGSGCGGGNAPSAPQDDASQMPLADDQSLTTDGSGATGDPPQSTGLANELLTPSLGVPDDAPLPTGSSTDTTAISGLWNITRTLDDVESDVLYVDIDPAGVLTEYDYQQDGSGDGRNCYIARTFAIVSRGDDRYDIADDSALPGSAGSEDVLIAASEDAITFRFLSESFDASNGSTVSGMMAVFPALAGITTEDLDICEPDVAI